MKTRFSLLLSATLLCGCAGIQPPALPEHNPANPQVGDVSRSPQTVLAADATTQAVKQRLSHSSERAKSSESMAHNMGGMSGIGGMEKMQNGGETHQAMPAMSHDMGGMKMDEVSPSPSPKQNDGGMKHDMPGMNMEVAPTRAGGSPSSQAKPASNGIYYTCVMHPHVHEDKPGKCPICGMKLVQKKASDQSNP